MHKIDWVKEMVRQTVRREIYGNNKLWHNRQISKNNIIDKLSCGKTWVTDCCLSRQMTITRYFRWDGDYGSDTISMCSPCCVLAGVVTKFFFCFFFCLPLPGIEHLIFFSRWQHTYYYTTMAVCEKQIFWGKGKGQKIIKLINTFFKMFLLWLYFRR